jgi:hypothetical protein
VGKTVRVTKVTVEYAFEGKAFRVEFPEPDKIASIIFGRTDFERLKKQQEEDLNQEAKPHFLAPDKPFPALASDGDKVLATSAPLGTTSAPSGTFDRSLWWHTGSCGWFHPEEDV